MAIKLKSLEQLAKTYTEQRYVYKDLSLDLQQSSLQEPGFNLPIPGTDIKASFDLGAIRNSLQNLFNTLPGQRFLFPEYGLDLHQFLFLPISDNTSQAIADKMLRGIQRFEPRVSVQNINVIPDIDNNTYNITIVVQIPIFQQNSILTGQLNIKTQTFTFLPTTRNR
jgi:phage baseplate assembly protein W